MKLETIADPKSWVRDGQVWKLVIAHSKTGTPAIEFRMDRLGSDYRVREWTHGAEDNLSGWFVGVRGIEKTRYNQRPPFFGSAKAAAIAAANYYLRQYGASACHNSQR